MRCQHLKYHDDNFEPEQGPDSNSNTHSNADLNSLANQYGLAMQHYANTHPSIGNSFIFTTGQIITNDDGYTATVGDDNLVRHLLSAGKTWKSYSEDLPSVG